MPNLGDTKVATFVPVDSKTLKPEATAWVGWRGTWRYLWTHDEGRYKGQSVWEPEQVPSGVTRFPFALWCLCGGGDVDRRRF